MPIYEESWGADEELLLLEGCEIYGLGSWNDIANHIGGYRTKEEVADHYHKTYIESPNFPLPERASPADLSLIETVPRSVFQANKKRRIESRKEEAKNAPPATPKTKPTASVPSCHEVAGYMPGRLEFEHEHVNEAEEAVAYMQFEPGDGINPQTGEVDPEVELKMTVMNIYNSKLDARLERKKIIHEHGLLEYKKNAAFDKKRTKEERELLQKAKPFARMMNRIDFETFTSDQLYELHLRQAISQLQDWRRAGVKCLAEGPKYEEEKAARAHKQVPMGSLDRERVATQKAKTTAPETPSGAAVLVLPELPIKVHHELNPPLSNGIDSPLRQNGTGTPIPTAIPRTKKEIEASLSLPIISGITPLATLSTKSSGEDVPWADTHLLLPRENELCRILRFQPKTYITVKELVLEAALQHKGHLKRKHVRELWPKGLDQGKGSRMFDAFVSWGWIGKA